jgi:hypothetical protein
MTAIAALLLFDNEIRREFKDPLSLIPAITTALAAPHVGVRYAACQCVRALSRAIATVRTSIMDSGLGLAVFRVFNNPAEDRRVTYAALCGVCNLLNEFSPLRSVSPCPGAGFLYSFI